VPASDAAHLFLFPPAVIFTPDGYSWEETNRKRARMENTKEEI